MHVCVDGATQKMKKSIWIVGLLGWVMVLFSGMWQQSAQAAGEGFTVKAELPENQRDTSASYFDLRVSPNQAQTLNVVIQNRQADPVTVLIKVNPAFTNDNGVVEYGEQVGRTDASLKVNFKTLLKAPTEVTIPAFSQQTVPLQLKLPAQAFAGTVLGGLQFMAKPDEKATTSGAVANRYVYALGVVLTESDQVVPPNLRLREVKAVSDHGHNAIQANIQNFEPAMLKDLTVEGKIFEADGSKALYQTHKQQLKMAPNSNFNFKVDLNDEPLKPGKYRFEGVAKAAGRTWHFKKTFVVAQKEAADLNAAAVKKVPAQANAIDWRLLILAGLVVLLTINVIAFKRYARHQRGA